MDGERAFQNLSPLHVVLQKNISHLLSSTIQQLLDYPSDQPFSKFHVMLTSCIWHHSSFGKKETVLLQLSQRQNIWPIKPSKPDTINVVHSPSSSSLQPLPLAAP